MENFRPMLRERGVPDSKTVSSMRDGARTRYVGIVICRQRPGTSTGITFMTLEDEYGFANVVIRRDVFERFDHVAKTASVLEVEGTIQSAAGVVHLIAESLGDFGERERTVRNAAEMPKSRDFH
jgi:error-prone DNA polymerase